MPDVQESLDRIEAAVKGVPDAVKMLQKHDEILNGKVGVDGLVTKVSSLEGRFKFLSKTVWGFVVLAIGSLTQAVFRR